MTREPAFWTPADGVYEGTVFLLPWASCSGVPITGTQIARVMDFYGWFGSERSLPLVCSAGAWTRRLVRPSMAASLALSAAA